MKDKFDANFYIVTATVIPVLYIALLVQFPMMGQASKRLTDRMDKLKTTSDHSESWARSFKTKRMADLAELGAIITLVVGGLLIASGILGEIQSILALYHQSDTPATGQAVLSCFIVLLVATLLGPAWTILIAAGRYWYHSEFSKEDRNNFEQTQQMSKEARNIFGPVPAPLRPPEQGIDLPVGGIGGPHCSPRVLRDQFLLDELVEFMQVDVTEDRGHRTALRNSAERVTMFPVFEVPGFQHVTNQPEKPVVMDFLREYP